MDSRKILVLVTTALFFLSIALLALFSRNEAKSIEITCPVFGNVEAPTEMVLFEDFKCSACHRFSKEMLPRLMSDYVLPGKGSLKVVPLGFLEGSKGLANAALEVCRLSPERFFSYAKRLFEIGNLSLLDLAKEVGGIDLVKLQRCIEEECHFLELDRNLAQAKSLMGKAFLIPALYINGIRVDTEDYGAIQQAMERAGK